MRERKKEKEKRKKKKKRGGGEERKRARNVLKFASDAACSARQISTRTARLQTEAYVLVLTCRQQNPRVRSDNADERPDGEGSPLAGCPREEGDVLLAPDLSAGGRHPHRPLRHWRRDPRRVSVGHHARPPQTGQDRYGESSRMTSNRAGSIW